MLGCKVETANQQIADLQELIDTCWDVKVVYITAGLSLGFELIDTCWDVKGFCFSARSAFN